jgi:hypothetical protein
MKSRLSFNDLVGTLLDPARLVFIDETAVSTNLVRLNGGRHGASG